MRHDEVDVGGEAAPEGAVAAEGRGAERVGDLVLVQSYTRVSSSQRTHHRTRRTRPTRRTRRTRRTRVPAMNWAIPP